MSQQHKVVFQPQGRTVFVLPGTKIFEAAALAGMTINTPCGGGGTCGKCRVQITSGQNNPCDRDKVLFDAEQISQGWRLACQTSITTDTVIEVPQSSRLVGQYKIQTDSSTDEILDIQPSVRKVFVQMNKPTLEDHIADMTRLENQIGEFKISLSELRQLPAVLRVDNYKGTAVLSDSWLLDFEPGDTTEHSYGVSFDIGTTTVVGSLLDFNTGQEIAIESQMNPQITFGDDVLSRINHSKSCPNCLEDLRSVIIGDINAMIGKMCISANIHRDHIYEVSFAGNTTMEHLLCGINPEPLGEVPFTPAHNRGLSLRAVEVGININPQGMVYVFPVIGGFVGGDTVACILSTRLDEIKGPVLLIDIGTNGEIVLCSEGKILAASTAAGPAFEGARIKCGMRATAGSIEKVEIDDDIRLGVIGNIPAVGLCGSALIDLAAQMLSAGLVSETGQMLSGDSLPPSLSQKIKVRVRRDSDDQPEFVLCENSSGNDIVLTQRDIRELQLAVGAVRAGVNIMLKKANLKTKDLERVLIAGGFGSFIRRTNAQRLGLLPVDIDHKIINYVGNASLSGARWALLSMAARQKAEKIAQIAEHVELSLDTGFQMEFAEAMIFPSS